MTFFERAASDGRADDGYGEGAGESRCVDTECDGAERDRTGTCGCDGTGSADDWPDTGVAFPDADDADAAALGNLGSGRGELMLFTGGCRSGKSALAQRWIESRGSRWAYVATARADLGGKDAEFALRITRHQANRGHGWRTFEPQAFSVAGRGTSALHDVPTALRCAAAETEGVLFDCVTLWLAGLLASGLDDKGVLAELDRLLAVFPTLDVPVALVSNEVGWGLVPPDAATRRFRDLAGLVNQRLAAAADGLILAVCGLPLAVKGMLPVSLQS